MAGKTPDFAYSDCMRTRRSLLQEYANTLADQKMVVGAFSYLTRATIPRKMRPWTGRHRPSSGDAPSLALIAMTPGLPGVLCYRPTLR